MEALVVLLKLLAVMLVWVFFGVPAIYTAEAALDGLYMTFQKKKYGWTKYIVYSIITVCLCATVAYMTLFIMQ